MSNFPLTPDFPIEITSRNKTRVVEFESGAEQRSQAWASPIRFYRLNFVNRPIADWTTMRTFFVTSAIGQLNTFTFTDPTTASAIICRFATDDLPQSREVHGYVSWTTELREIP